ncbi:28S ribosomal protein S24, mitochondrial [Aplysia californica]|uniref:28S ribosomal protein S24, mitochondrial n=1 Tax=Aplysia californica TaxID=6500 RepID=A0ABM0JFP5_APLCA|nr:28S ribosomal protein S24, mitochondrial [Aplysia californica]
MWNISQVLNRAAPLSSLNVAFRGLSTTACLAKNKKSGVPKVTRFRTKPLTYEEAIPPSEMNVRKGWLSWNTSNLHGEKRIAETTFEDLFIRKFVFGTWHNSLASEVVIKRRHNMITLVFLVNMDRMLARQVYFLQGYTEELLTHWLKGPVKVELQTVNSREDVIFKKI